MTIKISGIELELPDGCTIEVADEGKKIIVKAAGATEVQNVSFTTAGLTFQLC